MELESVKKIKAILEKHNVSKYVSKKEHTHKVGDLIKEDTREWQLVKNKELKCLNPKKEKN